MEGLPPSIPDRGSGTSNNHSSHPLTLRVAAAFVLMWQSASFWTEILVGDGCPLREGCETCEQYAKDAEQAGDKELAEYFRRVQRDNSEMAEEGRRLLGQRMNRVAA